MPIYKKEKNKLEKFRTIAVPAVQIPTALPQSYFKVLLKKAKKYLKFLQPKKEKNLVGRIHELDADVETLYKSLVHIRSMFEPTMQYDIIEDPDLGIFPEALIDPLLKEADLLTQTLHSPSIAGQAKVFKRYNLWIDRSKHWVDYFDRRRSKKELMDEVIHYLVGEALVRIDRDIEIIREYMSHQIIVLPLDEDRKKYLKHKIEGSIESHVENLMQLKKRPSKITLEGIGYWKSQIDQCRQTYFDTTLHAIDRLIEDEHPAGSISEEYLQESSIEAVILEREVLETIQELQEVDLNKPPVVKGLLAHIHALEEEAHEMLLDLRLDGEIINKVENALQQLSEMKAQLWFKKHKES